MSFTIPGLGSGIDVETMVNNMLATKMEKLTKYKTEQTQNTYKEDVFKDLRSSIEKLQKTSKALSSPTALLTKNATSSNSSVSVSSTTNSAQEGMYVVDVQQMATASSVALKPSTPITDAKQSINTTGSTQQFSYTVNGETKTIQVAAGATLEDLVNTINKTPNNLGVRASLLKDGDQYVFRMQSTETGSKNSISIDSGTTLSGFENSANWDTQTGQDALYKIDGYPSGTNWISSSSNTISDAIEGVTINLQGTGSSTITVGISSDKMVEKIEEFVNDVNSVLGMLNDINKPRDNTSSSSTSSSNTSSSDNKTPSLGDGYTIGDHSSIFYNNSYVNRIQSTIQGFVTSRLPGFTLYNENTQTGDLFSSLGNIGITFDSTLGSSTYGQLVIDKDKLQSAVEQDPEAVANLISADTVGSATSSNNSFYFNSAMKGITQAGSYDVSYEIDSSGNVTNATIGGYAATYNSNTKTLTVTDGDARGTAITLTDFTPGKVTGTVNIKDGAATSISEAITDMFLTNGDLTKLSEEIKSDVKRTNSLIESEQKRLTEEREKLLARFTAMDLRISQMNSQLNLLSSYIGLGSSNS